MEFFQAVVPWHISEISWQNISSVPFLLPQHGCLGIVFRAESLIGCSPPRILRYPMRPIPSGLRTYDIFTIDVPFHKFEFVSFCWPQNPCFIWWLNPTRPMYNFGVTFWTRSGVWWVPPIFSTPGFSVRKGDTDMYRKNQIPKPSLLRIWGMLRFHRKFRGCVCEPSEKM